MNKFEFEPVTAHHFPLLFDWLNRPHVADRWDGAMTYDEVATRFTKKINSTVVFPFIVKMNGHAIGYIQTYDAANSGDGWWPDEVQGTWGVDQFIAEENLLGQGIGSEFVREFTNDLISKPEIKKIITDPSPDNLRAIRAYEKAGFMKTENIVTPDGPALLMVKLKSPLLGC